MKGEKEFFRKRFFGGFNREDVVKYIAKIADERNEALAAQEKAETKAQELAEELRILREGADKTVAEQPAVAEEVADEQVAEEPVVVEQAIEEPVVEPVAIPAVSVAPPQAYTLPPLEAKREPAPPQSYTLPPLEARREPAAPQVSALPPMESINTHAPVAPVAPQPALQPQPVPVAPQPAPQPAPAPEAEKKPRTARLKVKRR